MKTESISWEIGFADSEIKSMEKVNDKLSIQLIAWNESIIQLKFSGVIYLLDRDSGDISDFCKVVDKDDLIMEDALNQVFEKKPDSHSYLHYSFLNHDDKPSLDIVAEEVDISIVNS